jgi:hypothetical protein
MSLPSLFLLSFLDLGWWIYLLMFNAVILYTISAVSLMTIYQILATVPRHLFEYSFPHLVNTCVLKLMT